MAMVRRSVRSQSSIDMSTPSRRSVSYFRNFVFGVEDSLVSTVGLLAGVASAGVESDTILLTGVVLILVEAFSMSAGSYLSESSAEEYADRGKITSESFFDASIMFISYFLSGFIPLAPYIIWPVDPAMLYSILFSLVSLGILGAVGSSITHAGLVRSIVRMLVIGGVAIAVGVGAGVVVGV